MDQKSLESSLQGLGLSKIVYFDSAGSTNDIVADWARAGEEGLCLAVADEQRKGRGRSGRRWITPPGSALAFSLLLPEISLSSSGHLGRVAGLASLAVCHALEKHYSLSPKIKWPNDVLLDGRKFCGVLPEAHWSGESLQALILGIGINIAPTSVPQKKYLNFPATCLEDSLGKPVKRLRVLRQVLKELSALIDRLQSDAFAQAWESRLAFLGQDVLLSDRVGNSFQGRLLGLNPEGQLRLRLADNQTRLFQSGEIRLRPVIDRQDK